MWGSRDTEQRRKPEPEPSLPTLILQQDEDPDSPKRVSFRVKETVCPRTTQQPPEQCDFKENGVSLGLGAQEAACQTAEQRASSKVPSPWCEPGSLWPGGGRFHLTLSLPFQLLKRCEGTVTLDQVRGNFDITCNNVSGPFCTVGTAVGVGCGTCFAPKTHCLIQGRERPSYPAPSLPEPQVSSPGCVALEQWLSWGPHPENCQQGRFAAPLRPPELDSGVGSDHWSFPRNSRDSDHAKVLRVTSPQPLLPSSFAGMGL